MEQKERALAKKKDDILRLLATKCHMGTKNCVYAMKAYVAGKENGVHLINVEETWQKIQLAARIIVTCENPKDVIVVSARPYGQRAVIKYAQYTNAISTSNTRWTPGTLTNQNTKQFREPRILIVTDPRHDSQAVMEASYVNIPCIGLCSTDSPLKFVDIVIPTNNRKTESIAMIYWLLAREVMILRGQLQKYQEWDVMPDLFFYREIKPQTQQIQSDNEDDDRSKEDGSEKNYEEYVDREGNKNDDDEEEMWEGGEDDDEEEEEVHENENEERVEVEDNET